MKLNVRNKLQQAFTVMTVGILVASLLIAGLWLLSPTSFNPGPFLGFLGLLYTAVPLLGQWLIKKVNTDLETERVTLPYALAYGYLTNYLAPVVKRLRRDSNHPETLCFFVYIPKKLEELQRSNIEDFLDELGNRKFEIDKIELQFGEQKRVRDVRTAKRLVDNASTLYFDFPTTLLTTVPAIDFKLDSSEGRSLKEQKTLLAEEYIQEFRNRLENMLEREDYDSIRPNIRLEGDGIDFLEKGCSES